jgi:hypothetical protein
MSYAVRVHDAGHPVAEMTSYELRDLRRNLEQALDRLPESDPERARLRSRLDAVEAEEDERQRAMGHPIL